MKGLNMRILKNISHQLSQASEWLKPERALKLRKQLRQGQAGMEWTIPVVTGSRRGKDVLPLTGRNLQGNMVWWLAGMIITSVLYLGYLMAIKQLTWYAMIAVPLGNLVGFWIYLRILLNRSRL